MVSVYVSPVKTNVHAHETLNPELKTKKAPAFTRACISVKENDI